MAFFGLNFILQKFCLCEKNDKYEVCVSHHCGVHCSSSESFLQLVLQERIETGETYKPTFVYLGVGMFVCLGIRVFQDFFIAGVSLLMCSYLQGAVRYWQQSLGPDFVYLLYRHFFIYAFVDLFSSVQFFAGREVHWRPLVTYWPAFVCLWGRNIQIRQTISKKCKQERYRNMANNLREM